MFSCTAGQQMGGGVDGTRWEAIGSQPEDTYLAVRPNMGLSVSVLAQELLQIK